MDRIAALSERERQLLFRDAAARRSLNPAIIEKDFWVCWVLEKLFADPEVRHHLIFKGGTTLSKVFGVIERFSEDIDLILDWRLLGFGAGGRDPLQAFSSAAQQDRFNKEMNALARNYIAGPLIEQLRQLFSPVPGVTASVDPLDGHTINVGYPASLSQVYLRPEVRLEIGPLGAWLPSSRHTIESYAAEALPEVFERKTIAVQVIEAERTFWEKATILHQEVHRTTGVPARYSRHYYDLFKLGESPVRAKALASPKLLAEVVEFKKKFYPSAWARYDLARPGAFRLLPSPEQTAALAKDYRSMAVMIFGEPPTFDAILEGLRQLEADINAIDPRPPL